MSEFDDILGRAVGQGALGLGPDEFVRVEFRSIGWEELDIEPPLLAQEVLDDEAFVDRASIPKQHHRAPQVPKQTSQEPHDLHPRDVGAVETEIESKPPPTGRDGDSGDRGDPIMPVAVSEDRGLPNRRPGLADIRHEEEAAFIEKGEMGPKSSGFFLYLATSLFSTGRWLARPAVWHGAPASATSIVNSPSLARHGPGGSEFQSASACARGHVLDLVRPTMPSFVTMRTLLRPPFSQEYLGGNCRVQSHSRSPLNALSRMEGSMASSSVAVSA